MNSLNLIASFAFMILVGVQATAQTPTPAPTPPLMPVEHNEAGQVRRWTFSDGREAILVSRAISASTLSFPFGVSSTSCPSEIAPQTSCQLVVPIKMFEYELHWSKHSDAAKIGKTVNTYGSAANYEITVSTYSQLKKKGDAYSGMAPTQLVCNDFTWLAGSKAAPQLLRMSSLSSETMTTNPETGQSENRTFSTMYDPEFVRGNDTTLLLKQSGKWIPDSGDQAEFALAGATVLHAVLDLDDQGNACQIALKPDVSTLLMQYEKYKKAGAETFKPHVMSANDVLGYAKSSLDNVKSAQESSFE